jgi:hypothetical protein
MLFAGCDTRATVAGYQPYWAKWIPEHISENVGLDWVRAWSFTNCADHPSTAAKTARYQVLRRIVERFRRRHLLPSAATLLALDNSVMQHLANDCLLSKPVGH